MSENTPAPETETPPAPENVPGADALGDPGKRALDAMKSQWHSERDRRKELEARLAALESDKGPDPDEIRRQTVEEITKTTNARLLRAEIKAAATGVLADPADALLYVDTSGMEADENGEFDAEKIRSALASLVESKPYLAAKAQRFEGTADGGAARNAPGPSQLTREDLSRMSPEQIVKAKSEGRLNDLLGIAT